MRERGMNKRKNNRDRERKVNEQIWKEGEREKEREVQSSQKFALFKNH